MITLIGISTPFNYANFVKSNNIKNYVEIDIDQKIGLDGVKKLRHSIEKIVGYKCMPVWHMNRGYDNWLSVCNDYDYVCFGAFITDGLSEDKYRYIPKFINDARKNNCKVHGLGMTSMKWLPKLNFYSVDSSTWTSGCRYGSLHLFDGVKIRAVKKPDESRMIDSFEVGSHNFYEWVKYSRYAERK